MLLAKVDDLFEVTIHFLSCRFMLVVARNTTVAHALFLKQDRFTKIAAEFLVRNVSFPDADLIGIGAAVTRRPLPHHRAYGSVHGGSSRLR
jgi:hypothetical protein